jgi:hypothetical protein
MLFQVAGSEKRFGALVTAVGFLAAVHQQVSLKVVGK